MKEQIKELNNQDLDSVYQKLLESKKSASSKHNYFDNIEYSKLEDAQSANEKMNEEQSEYGKKRSGKGLNEKREKLVSEESGVNVNKMKELMIERAPEFRHEIKVLADDEIRNMFNTFHNTNSEQQKERKSIREKQKSVLRENNEQMLPSESIFMENSMYSQRRINEKGRSNSFEKNNEYVSLNCHTYSDGYTDRGTGDKNNRLANNGTNPIQQKLSEENYGVSFNSDAVKNIEEFKNLENNQTPKIVSEAKKLNKSIKKRIKCKLTLYLNESDLEEGSDVKEIGAETYQSEKRLKVIKLEKIIRALHHTFSNGDWKLKEE